MALEWTATIAEAATGVVLDASRQRVIEFFLTVDPQQSLDTSARLRYPNTGVWLTQMTEVRDWLGTPGTKLWLSGLPGVGKTVLAGAVIQEAICSSLPSSNFAVAYFFCDFKDPRTLVISNILGAIAAQIAKQKEGAFTLLQRYFDKLHSDNRVKGFPHPDALRALVTKMSQLYGQILIVVDGLDECRDSMGTVADALALLAIETPNISMALFSRDEYDVRERLAGEFKNISIAAANDDIQLYVDAELRGRMETQGLQFVDTEFQDGIWTKLVTAAHGR